MAEEKDKKEVSEKKPDKKREAREVLDIHMANEVIAVISALAATETEGVASLFGGMTHEQVTRANMRTLSKAVALSISEKTVTVSLNLVLTYASSVGEVCSSVQEKVKTAVENMTGFTVNAVNIKVAGLAE